MTQAVASSTGAHHVHPRAGDILRTESVIWLPLAIMTAVIASVLMSGWPAGLVPNLSYPYTYSGDGLAVSWSIQKLLEGWIFHTDRSGYPFGSDFFDYPMSDAGSFAILKLLGWVTGSYWGALNLYFLLGFPVAFVASYAALRAFGISRPLSATGSILFVLLPYHFQRLEHLFLTWYFPVPIFLLLAWRLYSASSEQIRTALRGRNAFVHALVLLVLASFGVYYALFGTIVLIVAGLAGWLRTRSMLTGVATVAAVLLVAIGIGLNVAPNIIYTAEHGANPEVARRGVADSETYGLKLIQLVLPRSDHRIAALGKMTQRYDRVAPLVNENTTATLGLIGVAGLCVLGTALFARSAGRAVDERLAFLALIVMSICAIATIGGLSAVFAALVSPQLRGWNRMSVLVAFGAIAAAMIALDWLLVRFTPLKRLAPATALTAIAVAVLGALDQTVPACEGCNRARQAAFERDRQFGQSLEERLPKDAAVYQLPYMAFPEVPPLNRLRAYELAAGAIHSERLRWSYAGMKGREGDLFFRALAQQPMTTQLDVIRRLHFSGIYVDRRGYSDGGRRVEDELRKLLGSGPALLRSDSQVAFYVVDPPVPALAAGMSPASIMQLAGFKADRYGTRFAATLHEGIDLRREGLPDFVHDIDGLSGIEAWGRWSDANLSRSVVIAFRDPLPRSFILALRGQAFGPNAGKPVLIKVGSKAETITLSNVMEQREIRFDLPGEAVSKIEIVPPVPISPIDLGASDDPRRLGIGLERVWFERLSASTARESGRLQ